MPFISTNRDYHEWADCAVEGCPNKACLALDSQFCFPHTPGNEHVKKMRIDANRIYAGLEVRPVESKEA